jgi:RNA polymerase sigma-70 factor (ECF subfamily)
VSDLALLEAIQRDGSGDAVSWEEHVWVERARAGDVEAFDAIMAHYETRILRFLTGTVGDVEVARELCQDTFLAAYRALPKLNGELRLSSWLYTIALNRARSHHRRRRFRTLVPLLDDTLPSAGPDLQAANALQDSVQRALARLPEHYAHPLLLQITGGMSCREIADVLQCSESAVKVRLMRARKAFRAIYEEEEHRPCMS